MPLVDDSLISNYLSHSMPFFSFKSNNGKNMHTTLFGIGSNGNTNMANWAKFLQLSVLVSKEEDRDLWLLIQKIID